MGEMLPIVVVGLGNPGAEYANTRHNAGAMVIDRLLERVKRIERRQHKWNSSVWGVRHAGRELLLVRPLTYMNNSGQAVGRLQRALGLVPQDILVVYDCIDLPFGRLRMRSKGGSGGHRGMESVIQVLGARNFPRLRVGVGRKADHDVAEYVLDGWSTEEQARLQRVLDAAVDAVLYATRAGVERAMNRYNSWSLNGEADDNNKKENVS